MIAQIIAERIKKQVNLINNFAISNESKDDIKSGAKMICERLYQEDKKRGFIKTHYSSEENFLKDCGFFD